MERATVPGENERPLTPLVAGRYVLGEPIASGGMGTVHLGRLVGASGFARVVAIKRLFPGYATDASFRRMLLDEARFASRVRQPNVVPILDLVEAERDLFVVMEYVHGLSLASLLEQTRGKPMPVEIALAIAEGVLLGLHAAHEARNEDGSPLGIVHRDVSPQNVLVGADGVVRLIDFGIAKAATRIQVTEPGTLKGKAAYMAPEQLLQERVARQADIFAASLVLWEMLANRALFASDVAERVRRVAELPPPPGRERKGIDATLDALVVRGLARDPAQRFATAEAMALELRRGRTVASPVEVARWIASVAADELELSEERVRLFEQSSGTPAPDGSGGAPLLASVVTPGAEPTSHAGPPRRRAWIGPMALVLALVAAVVGVRFVPHGGAPATPPTATPMASPPLPPSAPPPTPTLNVTTTPTLTATPTSTPSGASPSSSPPAHPSSKSHPRGPKPKCDPPYTVDADGFKHYDPRCF